MTFAAIVVAWLLWAYFRRTEIRDPVDGSLYLTRYRFVRLPWCRLFVHRIHRPDKGRDLHNHPWPWARALILRGGYTERARTVQWGTGTEVSRGMLTLRPVRQIGVVRTRFYGPMCINTLESTDYHRISAVKPGTWTLFLAGRRSRDWGFLVNGVHIPWRTYLGLPADAKLED